MRLLNVTIPARRGETWTIWPLGDLHLGSANCDLDLFRRVVDQIRADDRALWVGMGDMVEAIAPNDPRWQAGGVDEKIVNLASQDRIGDVYVEKLADLLHPIANKLLVYGDGNHEQRFSKTYYTHLSSRVLDRLGRPECYGGWASLTRVVFAHDGKRFPLRIWASHGWQAGRQDGAKVNQARHLLAYIDADLYLQGHSHSKFIVPQTRLRTNQSCTKLIQQVVYAAHTGSFLRTLQQDHVGYAERAGYPPTTLGPPRFFVRIGCKGLEIEGAL